MSHILWAARYARALPALCARPGSLTSTSALASFASNAQDETTISRPSTSGQDNLPGSKQLTAESLGRYYLLSPALLPEASRASAGAFYAPRDPGHERGGGCKALQQEVEATGRHAIMYRPVMHELYRAVGDAAGSHRRLLLSGPAGAGKSVALAGLVEWARQHGWLVLYIPSCLALVRGGYFSPRADAPRSWDTLTSAQQVLKGIMDAHGDVLKRLPLLGDREAQARIKAAEAADQAEGGVESTEEVVAAAARKAAAPVQDVAEAEDVPDRTLYDLAAAAVAQDEDARLAVDTVLRLVRQLAAAAAAPGGSGDQQQQQAPQVLFVLDDYNYLYGLTDYGTHPGLAPAEEGGAAGGSSRRRRQTLHSDELVLASGMRLLELPSLGAARVVAATTTAPALPTPRPLPLSGPYTELPVPGFSEDETRNALAHYYTSRHASILATSRQARQLQALTQGNARELRLQASSVGIRLK